MENSKTYKKIKDETFNIEKAINRLQWRFKNDNVKVGESKIIINELDLKAVDFLINWVNQQKQETLKENLLFAKMFTYSLYHETIYYKGNIKQSSRSLQEKLELPIQYHYNKIHEVLNMFELNHYMNSIGVSDKHPLLRTNEEDKKNRDLFIKNNEEVTKKILGTWTLDSVYKSLNNTITECINRYKNKP